MEHQVKSPHLPQWSEQVDSKKVPKTGPKTAKNRSKIGSKMAVLVGLDWTKPRLTYFKQAVLK